MLALRSVSAASRRYKSAALVAAVKAPRSFPTSTTAIPRYQSSTIRARTLATQTPIGAATKPVPDNRSIVPLENPDPSIDLTNIQGDIYPTFPKKSQRFIFFSITSPKAFRAALDKFRSSITTSAQVIQHLEDIQNAREKNKGLPKPIPKERLVKLEQFQIGFSLSGLKALNVGGVGDGDFAKGPQRTQAESLGDEPLQGTAGPTFVGKHWLKDWREKQIDGVIVAASESCETCEEAVKKALAIFGSTINVQIIENGKVRPGDEEGHEHFGFLDGVSQPALKGLVKKHAGQLECDPGVIIMGLPGDSNPGQTNLKPRPDWATGGSLMAFRKLHQRVPEFNRFLAENPIKKVDLSDEEGSELRGARMVGRWKSGVPIDLSPEEDDHAFLDPEQINNFRYHLPEPGQARCPFSAHIRKTAPREHNDLTPSPAPPLTPVLPHALIMRAGIPYGPEVSPEECDSQTTADDRGLLFVSYQSALANFGFSFLQRAWANNSTFPAPEANSFDIGVPPGFDPIIGNKVGPDRTRITTGTDATFMAQELTMKEDFVVAEGGEYFFVPPMKTIERIAKGETLVGVDPPAGPGGPGGAGAPPPAGGAGAGAAGGASS